MTVSNHMSGKIGIIGTKRFMENFAKSCSREQFAREFTHNSIQAICDEGIGSRIEWGYITMKGVRKLFIVDDGPGMTPEEMRTHLCNLSSSKYYNERFGLGAKASAMAYNKKGILYVSKVRGGDWYAICLYGHAKWKELETPKFIYSHKSTKNLESGTIAIFFGNENGEDAARNYNWLTPYLNNKYFRFPEGIVIKDNLKNIIIKAKSEFLDRHCNKKGSVDLGRGVTAHWWILKGGRSHDAILWPKSCFGVVYKDEIYHIYEGNSGRRKLQGAGVTHGVAGQKYI